MSKVPSVIGLSIACDIMKYVKKYGYILLHGVIDTRIVITPVAPPVLRDSANAEERQPILKAYSSICR